MKRASILIGFKKVYIKWWNKIYYYGLEIIKKYSLSVDADIEKLDRRDTINRIG